MNRIMLLKMAIDTQVIKTLWKYNKMMRKDKSYSLIKGIKMGIEILRDEKIVRHNGKYIICTFMPPFPSKAFDNHMMAVMDEKKIFTDQIYSRRSAPISFHVALTHRCMYRCLYCSARDRGLDQELTAEEWSRTFNDMQEMGTSVVGITGGEPLLRRDLVDIIDAIDERSSVMLFTTGKGLTCDVAQELKEAGLFGVGISLDTVDEERHNTTRGNEKAYEIAVKGIENSLKTGLYTMIQTVVLERDLDEEKLYDLFYLAKRLGVHEVKILEPIMSGELMKEDIEEGIFYSEESRKKLIDIGLRANKSGEFPKITTFAHTESKERYGCGAGTQHSYITAQGDVFPCDFVPMTFGNVKNRSIKDIWSSMNNAIGIPKRRCFAMEINPLIKKEDMKTPLDIEISKRLCIQCRGKEYPQFYKKFQK